MRLLFQDDQWPTFRRGGMASLAHMSIVEGHPLQGQGCTPCNLAALIRAILADPRRDSIVDFLCEAIRLRRQYRQGL